MNIVNRTAAVLSGINTLVYTCIAVFDPESVSPAMVVLLCVSLYVLHVTEQRERK